MQIYRACLTAIVTAFMISSQIANAQITTDSDVKPYSAKQRTRAEVLLPEIRSVAKDASRLLTGESVAATLSGQVGYTLKMIESIEKLRRDPRLQRSAYLKRAEQQLVSRLKSIANRTRVEHRRRKQAGKNGAKPERIEIRQEVLAQLNAAAGVNAGVNVQNANGGNQGNQDYGQLLVDLIQRTISPGSWDVNGGLSSAQYFRPRHALVVRAPQDVHDELSPILHQLRKQ